MTIEETLHTILETVQQLAEKLSETEEHLHRIEAAKADPQLLGVRELCFALNCKPGTVYKMFREGRLTNRSNTRHVKASREEVAALLRKGEETSKVRPSFAKRRTAYATRKTLRHAELIGNKEPQLTI